MNKDTFKAASDKLLEIKMRKGAITEDDVIDICIDYDLDLESVDRFYDFLMLQGIKLSSTAKDVTPVRTKKAEKKMERIIDDNPLSYDISDVEAAVTKTKVHNFAAELLAEGFFEQESPEEKERREIEKKEQLLDSFCENNLAVIRRWVLKQGMSKTTMALYEKAAYRLDDFLRDHDFLIQNADTRYDAIDRILKYFDSSSEAREYMKNNYNRAKTILRIFLIRERNGREFETDKVELTANQPDASKALVEQDNRENSDLQSGDTDDAGVGSLISEAHVMPENCLSSCGSLFEDYSYMSDESDNQMEVAENSSGEEKMRFTSTFFEDSFSIVESKMSFQDYEESVRNLYLDTCKDLDKTVASVIHSIGESDSIIDILKYINSVYMSNYTMRRLMKRNYIRGKKVLEILVNYYGT